ncbi:hypothetical protein [Streptococcus uberis]|uniref:hypothetical protein n=1 Tax=Streptococcus uberis TaxID=1349 RepID=UPI001FF5929A|nr:hypothetical protein [Streptococcus uberis]MCK1226537.1 hypothetical protein [Streptococcus uberis]
MKKCFMLFLLICLVFADLMPVMAMDKEDFSKPQVIESQLDTTLTRERIQQLQYQLPFFEMAK